jgi:hypothetical protein
MLVKIRTDYEDSPWIAAGKIYGRYWSKQAATQERISLLGS